MLIRKIQVWLSFVRTCFVSVLRFGHVVNYYSWTLMLPRQPLQEVFLRKWKVGFENNEELLFLS